MVALPINRVTAGVDEVGRGPLAGPVVAAAVCLEPEIDWSELRDSKKLSPGRRVHLDEYIREYSFCWAIGSASVEEIDTLNIRNATHLAMQRAISALDPLPTKLLVDGNDLPPTEVPAEVIIGGDNKVPAIAAASIIAKVHRDQCLQALHKQYPAYGFDRHSGYPTPAHLACLARLGPTPAHRRSFAPVRAAIEQADLLI